MSNRVTDDVEQHRKTYDEHGYIVFRNIVPKAQLQELHASLMKEFERVSQDGSLFAGGGLISGHLNCFPGEQCRFIHEALQERGIEDLIRELSPKSMKTLNLGCNFNLPGSVAQHYHADGLFTEDFTIANVAVIDTTIENGAIDLLPGTHKRFYPYWQFAVERVSRLSTRIPMQQGDVLVRSSVTWHRGMPNKTKAPRPMVAFTYGEKHDNRVDGDPFKHNGGKIAFLPNWYSPNLLGRLRERTFVKAPITYSAYRFARSLVGNKGYATF